MGRQESDPARAINAGPSIALLQERFKKLERIKEKRSRKEENELQMFSSSSTEPKRILPTNNYINYNSFSHDRLFLPSRPDAFHHDPLSLGLNLSYEHADYRARKRTSVSSSSVSQPPFSSLWSAAHDKRGVKIPQKFEVSEVDTSLHL